MCVTLNINTRDCIEVDVWVRGKRDSEELQQRENESESTNLELGA